MKKQKKKLSDISEEAGLEAEILLSRFLQVDRAWILAHTDFVLEISPSSILDSQLEQRSLGTPLPYILGSWEFHGKSFQVSPEVLIPRPETELLVELASAWLQHHPAQFAVDIGTGSGCIALSLAAQFPHIQWLATDISRGALRIAANNTRSLGLSDLIDFLQMDLLAAVKTSFDMICANLPYIPHERLPHLIVSRAEPEIALDGGNLGIALIARLVNEIPGRLRSGGLVLLEIDYTQAEMVHSMLVKKMPGLVIKTLPDLAGLPRVIQGEYTG